MILRELSQVLGMELFMVLMMSSPLTMKNARGRTISNSWERLSLRRLIIKRKKRCDLLHINLVFIGGIIRVAIDSIGKSQ